jgi:hypothetical protein
MLRLATTVSNCPPSGRAGLIAPMVIAVALQAAPPAPSPCGAPRSVRLLPVDQAATQPDFFTFRARLQAAVARRDEAAVLAAVDPGIRTSFGDDEGVATLRAKLRDPQSTIWADLGAALALGGRFQSPDSFVAPYVFAAWPDGLDSFECAAVVGDRVRVRASAATGSAVVGSASYEIVQVLPAREPSAATQVRLPNGRSGFIASTYVRSPIDYRAIFQKTGGQWRLRAFVAGD